MDIIGKDELFSNINEYKQHIENGAIFICPTDTIYGLCCDARNRDAIEHLRALKRRYKPLAIIAPSKEWIHTHCNLSKHEDKLDLLPGPYTLVYPYDQSLPATLAPGSAIGVRIPNHWIASFVETLGFPIVASSVNPAGMDPITTAADLERDGYRQFSEVAFFVDEGVLSRNASSVLDLTGEQAVYLRM